MTGETVILSLLLLMPLSGLLWATVLPKKSDPDIGSALFWTVPLVICIIPLGWFLAAGMALVYGEPLILVSFSWGERPLYAAKILGAAGLVGGLFSYGFAQLCQSLISEYRASRTTGDDPVV